MRKEEIIVPKDKCPLDVLSELGNRTAKAWIFLHRNVVHKLRTTCDGEEEFCNSFALNWNACKNHPDKKMNILDHYTITWYPVYQIQAENIAFHIQVHDPDEIFFLKMEE